MDAAATPNPRRGALSSPRRSATADNAAPARARNTSLSDVSPCTTPEKSRAAVTSSVPAPPRLSPSPKFREPTSLKRPLDDAALIVTPSKHPSRPSHASLSLQMPTADASPAAKSDLQSAQAEGFETPGSVLPRHSRGLDFARARTHLHHSTVPDQATPGSSPIVSHKSGIDIPSRRPSMFSSANESPRSSFSHGWNAQDRFFRPRSMGSATALTSDASASTSDEDDDFPRQDDEEMITTPQVNRELDVNAVTPYGMREETITGGMVHNPSPMQRRFHPFRRTTRAGRTNGRLAGWRRDKAQQRSPDDDQSVEDASEAFPMESMSRRESISTVTDKLRISRSNGNDSGDEGPFKFQSGNSSVARRPVTRRSNLLPKTKGFARIKAALQEENAPVDSEVKREAEVVRQVRVSDIGPLHRGQSNASASSPDLTPTNPGVPMDASDMSDIDGLGLSNTTSSSSDPPKQRPAYERRNSGFRDLWPRLHSRMVTPPPPLFQRPRSSSGLSGISEDMRLDSPATCTPVSNDQGSLAGTTSEAKHESDGDGGGGLTFQLPSLPSAAEISKKVGKRRREDDLDPAGIKRRAVSPGMSVHSSPVLGQSPVSSSGGWWGQQRPQRENSGSSVAADERAGSVGGGSGVVGMANPPTPGQGPKRVGMQQGMFDTNDGFTKMTLE